MNNPAPLPLSAENNEHFEDLISDLLVEKGKLDRQGLLASTSILVTGTL